MDITECSGNTYFSFLDNLSALTKDISGYHLMKLHKPSHALPSETIHLYTDILKLSIRGGGDKSHSLLDYVITSTTYNESFFILVATPAFYPDPHDELRNYIIEEEKPDNVKPFDYLCDYHLVLAEGISKMPLKPILNQKTMGIVLFLYMLR